MENSIINKKLVSIVIPCYNEEKNIPILYEELKEVLDTAPFFYEVIFVEDGSKDNTWQALLKLADRDKNVKLLRHGRNMGMTQGYQNGFDHANGNYVLTYSSDIETAPQEILRVVSKLEEGFDVVNTYRVGRWKNGKATSILRTLPSTIANELIVAITGIRLKDNGSGLKGFRKFVIKNLRMYGEMHRYFAAYCSLFTNKITEIDVEYRDRIHGQSSYGSITRTFKVFFDLFSLKFLIDMSRKPYSLMPGRLFGSVGVGLFSVGTVMSIILVIEKFALGQEIGGRPMLIFAVLFIILGVQLVMTGFLGELLMRIYFDSGNRKVYTIKEEVNLD
jgi:glycosyltransferase involved in cell wall biosynthesis